MSVDIEGRVRRANLIARDDQLESLFDQDLTPASSPTCAKKEGRMADTKGRQQSPIGDTSRFTTPPRRPKKKDNRPVLAWGLATLGIVAAVGISWAVLAGRDHPNPIAGPGNESDRTAEAVEVAESFMTSLNAHDVDAMAALTTLTAINAAFSPDGTLEGLRAAQEQEEVLGWTYHFTCEVTATGARGTVVQCPYSFSNHITEVYGLDPYPGSFVQMAIVDGEVTSFIHLQHSDAWQAEGGGLGMFYKWMVVNHPEDADSFYYNYTDQANLDFWKTYMPLFLASEEGP
jgi:hypothetical protein